MRVPVPKRRSLPGSLLAFVLLAVARQDERTDLGHSLAVPAADDLSAFVEAVRVLEQPARVQRNLQIQIRHHAIDCYSVSPATVDVPTN